MTAQILDGNALGQKLRAGFKQQADELAAQGVRPGLAVILVGEDPASQVYVRNKVNACAQAGFHSEKHVFPPDVAPQLVFDKIAELNADDKIHGILVQLPLPKHFDSEAVLDAITAEKDVDGFRAENVGALMQGQPCFIPCTPYGAMKFFEDAGISLKAKEAVVVGRSNIVGKPMAMLLMHAGATVTVCHSQTRDLKGHCLRADILAHGLRNSTLTALMPSETSSQIANATNGIEPPRGLVTVKSSKDGVLKQVVPEYERLKNQYELLWQMPNNNGYLKLVGVMQKFVDQSISANTNYDPQRFADGRVPMKQLLTDLLTAYKYGLKTLYYHNTRDGADDTQTDIQDDGCAGGACKI